jgi:hypothetical protein
VTGHGVVVPLVGDGKVCVLFLAPVEAATPAEADAAVSTAPERAAGAVVDACCVDEPTARRNQHLRPLARSV